MRKTLSLMVTAIGMLLLLTAPTGAQQLIDAGRGALDGSGGLAFVVFTIMVFAIGGGLFYMDRIRRRSSEQDRPPTS